MQEQIFTATNGMQVKYKHKHSKYDFNHIIFVFSGFNNPLPGKYDFINALNNCPSDIIWISDDFEGMHAYYLCINMDFKVEDAITEFINFQTKKRDLSFKDITVTGYSKGGSAALYYGLKLDISNIVVTVPQIHIGSYVGEFWKDSAEHIMGNDYTSTHRLFLNNLIPQLLKETVSFQKNIYLLTSEQDTQYKEHIEPFLPDLNRYSNFNLFKSHSLLVKGHADVTRHHTSFALSIYYALASEATPRFNNGKVDFFGSQSISTSEPSLEPFINLHRLTIINNRIYINGVGLLRGWHTKNYSDIDYVLIIKGKNEYFKNLAKAHNANLTRDYFEDKLVIYDKCFFTTYRYEGIDISDIEKGKYKIYLEMSIKERNYKVVKEIVSIANLNYDEESFSFISSSTNNELTIK